MGKLAKKLGWVSFKRNGAHIFNHLHGDSEKHAEEVV